ncbi:TniQ family protein [Methylobacterium soli]|uniref:TniQ family protein n=1 Tax=Methylobacterium soli TaxID=553447 RepID=UPI001780AC17|nr:TniQ family protein [Methylobacterium soli]
MSLHPAVEFGAGETPPSFASRLACRSGVPNARVFCSEMGIGFAGIVAGREPALASLARLVEMDVRLLRDQAIVAAEPGYRLRGQDLARHSLARTRVRICPLCLAEDIQRSSHPPASSAYGRATWCVAHLRTCDVHAVALLELDPPLGRATANDFAAVAARHIDGLGAMADAAQRREVSGLERYLLARLNGEATSAPWLDEMPFHAAAKVCEMIGAVATYGRRANLNRLGEDDWHVAGARGYAIASGGPSVVDRFLTDLRLSHKEGWLVANGPTAWFGRLYQWLAHYNENPAYDGLRQVVSDNLIGNVPLAPGERLFGKAVTVRKLHSLRTAYLETGLHPTRLRKVLSFTGHIAPDHSALSDHAVVFDAAATAGLLGRLSTALTFLELGPYLNTNRVQAKLLVEAGFIKPVVDGADEEVGWRCYAREDADAFLDALNAKAESVELIPEGAACILDAAKRACCHSREIVSLILGGQLAWVGRQRAERGYDAILVQVGEVRRHVRGRDLDGIPLSAAYKVLRTNWRVLNALVDNGIIATSIQRHPVNRAPLAVVSHEELRRFQDTYVSLVAFAEELGVHHLKLKRALAERGVHPELAPDRFHASFYRRELVTGLAADPERLGRNRISRGPSRSRHPGRLEHPTPSARARSCPEVSSPAKRGCRPGSR